MREFLCAASLPLPLLPPPPPDSLRSCARAVGEEWWWTELLVQPRESSSEGDLSKSSLSRALYTDSLDKKNISGKKALFKDILQRDYYA